MSQGIQPISALCPDLQQEIAALVTRMLSRDKYERPEDLREVAEVLARYAGSRPPSFGAASSVKEKFDSDPQLSGSGTPPARVVLSSKEKADPEADTDMWKHIPLSSESRERNTTGAHSMAVPSTPRRRNRWLAGDSTAPPTTLAPFFKSTVGKLVAVSVAAAAAASIAGVAWLDAAEAPPAPTSATAFSAPPVLTVVSDPAALDTVSMVREPSQGSRPSMPRSCAEVRDVTHATADGAYQIDSDGAGPGVPFPVYCTEMGDPALEPAEYLSLVHGPATGEPDANATTYVWSGGPCRCPDLTRRFTKVRLDPATLTVDVSDGRFSTYSRDRTCEAKDQNHCGASIELSWATAGSCRAGEDASGRGSIDLRDTPFSVAPEVAFVTSGNAAAGRASISTDRKTVALTGGGRCGVFLPSSAPKLRLSWDR
jgi:hypothetical protein